MEATRGTKDPKRMHEICQGAPPSYTHRPYPCPKPVGELAMQLPPDQRGMKIHQRLIIEEARLAIKCWWQSGVWVEVECFIPPAPNVLAVQWRVANWTETTRTGHTVPPVWFSLYRWADPTIDEFSAKFLGDYRHDGFSASCDPKVTPLPPPSVRKDGDLHFIEQTFPPDPLFKEGFRCLMAPFASATSVEPVNMSPTGEARLHLIPQEEGFSGSLVVAVTTSSDNGLPFEELRRIRSLVDGVAEDVIGTWDNENREKATEFWSRSRVSVADPLLENVWYETLHARHCTYRDDTVPPGLLLPSTVLDYSHWHGDYHTNYNIQSPFWGDYTANHLELGDAFFRVMDFFLPIGRKIARDYYNCRGVFIQLSGFPIEAEDDPLGIAPMGRMAYMTGWAMNQYWRRYLYTMDKEWLRTTGYPVIRDCALFYTDFMEKGEDGFYHVFPSNQGEDGFTGDPRDYTDRGQIMQHLRYCLRAAIRASEVLDVDEDLRDEWGERLEHCAGDDGQPPVELEGLAKQCHEANQPEFGAGRPYRSQTELLEEKPWTAPHSSLRAWYFGQYPWIVMQALRSGSFDTGRDFSAFREVVNRWRHPNGLIWAMAMANYGHAGAWTESLGVIAPLQEMMLQSWDGAVRIFSAWPKDLDARFENLRAEGAFLVTAAWSKGEVTELRIHSEKGESCWMYLPWPEGMSVVDDAGNETGVTTDEYGRASFSTDAGMTYVLSRQKSFGEVL
ncbi:MAG: hypothetical protein HY318_14730 [Armatimonadetes bacterium]|nr:hypothetical protein [Armatimonadota bacterium]